MSHLGPLDDRTIIKMYSGLKYPLGWRVGWDGSRGTESLTPLSLVVGLRTSSKQQRNRDPSEHTGVDFHNCGPDTRVLSTPLVT